MYVLTFIKNADISNEAQIKVKEELYYT